MNPVSLQFAGSRNTGMAPTGWGAFGPHWLVISSQPVKSPASPVSPASPGEFLPEVLCELVRLPLACETIVLPVACDSLTLRVECELN